MMTHREDDHWGEGVALAAPVLALGRKVPSVGGEDDRLCGSDQLVVYLHQLYSKLEVRLCLAHLEIGLQRPVGSDDALK
eukprot:scaffold29175_cov47-Prasinocladus_malaysianus.AAC.2